MKIKTFLFSATLVSCHVMGMMERRGTAQNIFIHKRERSVPTCVQRRKSKKDSEKQLPKNSRWSVKNEQLDMRVTLPVTVVFVSAIGFSILDVKCGSVKQAIEVEAATLTVHMQ